MTDQEIIDNAPEGATHYDCDEYMRHVHDGFWEYFSKADGWNETKPEEETRSLADIKRIAELEKTCKSRSDTIIEYSNKIAELEKERDEALRESKGSLIVLDGLKRRIRAAFEVWPDLAMFKDLSCLLSLKPSVVKLEAHNLRQQAKGVEDAKRTTIERWRNCEGHVEVKLDDRYIYLSNRSLDEYAQQLRKQVDELEQGE